MKAWIEGKKRTGPWKVRWREQIDGRWVKRASRSFGVQADAAAELDAVNERLAKVSALRPRRGQALLPFAEVVDRWKSAVTASGKVSSPYYAQQVETHTKRIAAEQGWATTAQITASAMDAWRASKARGTARPIAMFKAILRWARGTLKQPIDDDLLHMPIPQAKPRPAPPVLTAAHVAAIRARADSLGESIGAAVAHLVLFGCRPSDLCRLNVGDWNPVTRTLTLQQTKSRTRPSHPIGGPFADHAKRLDALTKGRAPSEPLFVNPTGERWTLDRVGAARQLGDWYWWHITYHLPEIPAACRCISALKDVAITNLDAAGIDDRTKTLFTGHKSLSVYARYKATNAERAAEALEKLGAHLTQPGGRIGGSSKLRGQNRGQKTTPSAPAPSTKPATITRKSPKRPAKHQPAPNRPRARIHS